MIHAALVFNGMGKVRLLKFYKHVPQARQQEIVRGLFNLISKRSSTACSFVEDASFFGPETKIIYRHFSTLFFVFAVDSAESELGVLDLIQVFVQTLDRVFQNVCELDLIFYSDKVHYILDEIVMGGMVLETNMEDIITAVQQMNKQDDKARITTPSVKTS
eukprot:GILJ01008044.1.p1 GENE.GILJ01008044.1~~GILJ01008044.1.p1  ORF type:complete len:161 (+),score=25.63 GILJ01008044.1:52-534(+)